MLACAIFILVLTDLKLNSHSVNAAQDYLSTYNDVGSKLKRDAEEGSCLIPEPLENGQFLPHKRRCLGVEGSSPACHMVPRTPVEPQWAIFYTCDPGYQLNTTKTASVCFNGRWVPHLPSCVESSYNSRWLPSKEVCGKSSGRLRTKRRIYGNESTRGSWPWMVIFGFRKSENVSDGIHWFCAGTLVTTRHILTAAHCVADYRKRPTFLARMDDINLDDSLNDGGVEVEIQKNNIVVHPAFRRERIFSHNIAIVKLTSDIAVTDFVRPICLPTPDFLGRRFTNETGFFTSWGQTDNDREWTHKRKHRHEPILHEVRATVVDHDVCKYNYKNYQSEDFVIIGWDIMCAAVNINKSCQGDAGSPLMLKIQDRYVLVGIVATPFRCYSELFPRLFTRLSEYMGWIIANLKF